MPKVLFVLTSADKTLDGKPIGWYLPEAAHPYYALSDHFNIDFASPKGGKAPLDQSSVDNFKDDESVSFLNDPKIKGLVENTKKLSDVRAEDYVAIFVVGGHGPMFDLAKDKQFAQLAQDFYAAKKPVAAVCHGPAALIQVTRPGTSDSILKGIQVTGFSNAEEAQTPYFDFKNTLPFSLEARLKEVGAEYVSAMGDGVRVIWEGGVLTGQNPASARPLGQTLCKILTTEGGQE